MPTCRLENLPRHFQTREAPGHASVFVRGTCARVRLESLTYANNSETSRALVTSASVRLASRPSWG